MRTGICLFCIGVLLAVAAFRSVSAQGKQTRIDNTDAVIEYAHDADTLVIQATMTSPWSGEEDAPPDLRIYGNGRAVIHLPNKPEGQRDYEFWLSNGEMHKLLDVLNENGALKYEYGVVSRRRAEAADQLRARVRGRDVRLRGGVADASSLSVEIFLKKYKPAGDSAEVQTDFYHRTGGYGLQYMARDFPEIEEARKLGEIDRVLRNLHRDRLLRPISPTPSSRGEKR